MSARPPRADLPIDPLLPEIVETLRDHGALVIEAPPGAGKTTRVPAALLEAGVPGTGEILVLQPRRLPARLAALRVADELGERPGQRVGYTVRFDDVGGPGTRLRFITEGILTRRLLADPELRGVDLVVLDEFHERHLATDLGLGLLVQLQQRRSSLRLCVMSATLDAEPIAAFLDDCPRLRSEGRRFEVAISHLSAPDERPLAEQVAASVRTLVREGLDGDVLVFLPGAGEIRRAADALASLADSAKLLVLPLHGDLQPAEQLRAVTPAAQRKVILSTNVAETSVTIDGVVAVLDSGLARLAGHSPFSGLSTLTVGKISQASAIQRAGRAGRTRPGRALRLYTRHDFDSRRAFDLPEVARLDLAEPVLALSAMGVAEPGRFPWFEPPPAAALGAANELLRRLHAVDRSGAITDLGRQMLRFPLHPRLSRLVVEGERRGVGPQAAMLAAMIEERDIEERARVQFGHARGGAPVNDNMDLLERLDRLQQAHGGGRDRVRGLGLDARAVEGVSRSARQIQGLLARSSRPSQKLDPRAADEALALATLAGFPDRVMRRRVTGGKEAVLAGGGVAAVGLAPPDDLLVAVDAEERGGTGKSRTVSVRLAVGIAPEALLEVAEDAVTSRRQLQFSAATERVEALDQVTYGQIVLEESRRPAPPSDEASALLLAAARSAGWEALLGAGVLVDLKARNDLFAQAFGAEAAATFDDESLAQALELACSDRTSFAELRALGPEGLLESCVPAGYWQRQRQELPARLRLPGGREATINYPAGREPFIESRLQDFFGMKVGPTICAGRVPIVLHLCAPNGRAVQVTRDLAGFWREHYPTIRRELSRRYPRHFWPEDGATAAPPPPRPPRAPAR
ncbi:MAG TPA: ATP-dependent helicase HrpB [Polyangia bacterium]